MNKTILTNYKNSNLHMVSAVGNVECPVEGSGDVQFVLLDGESLTLKRVLYSSKLRRNLSLSQLEEDYKYFIGKRGRVMVYNEHSRELFQAVRDKGLYLYTPKYNGKIPRSPSAPPKQNKSKNAKKALNAEINTELDDL